MAQLSRDQFFLGGSIKNLILENDLQLFAVIIFKGIFDSSDMRRTGIKENTRMWNYKHCSTLIKNCAYVARGDSRDAT